MDSALWFTAMALEIGVVVLVASRKLFKIFPVFSLYTFWAIASDLIGIILQHVSTSLYTKWFILGKPVDFALQFAVLVELSWSIVRPFRKSLPSWTLFALILLIGAAGAVIWPFTTAPEFAHRNGWLILARIEQTCSILRVLFFLALAGCSQLLAIGWRHRELQIATGLGIYSLIILGATVANEHQSNYVIYHLVQNLMVLGYCLSLLYWIVSFAQKEAARQDVSPKMKNVLMMVVGESKAAREALEEQNDKPRRYRGR